MVPWTPAQVKRVLLALVALAAAGAAYVAFGLPSPAQVRALATTNPGTTALMRQRDEEARRAGRPPRRRAQAWVPLGRVSRHLIRAVLASEDQRFFGHDGVDWEAIQKSLDEDRKKGRFARGGSTITQQLAKNLFFSTRKTPTRKLRELVAAHWLEQELSKRRILELYLNVIEWGDGIYGCEAAARRWFGKPASELDEEEAAGLAAMIPNPRRINPRADPARFARARRRVIALMAGAAAGSAGELGTEPPESETEDQEDEPAPPLAPAPAPEPLVTAEPEPSPPAPASPQTENEPPGRTGYDYAR